jgi:hypothetical protein
MGSVIARKGEKFVSAICAHALKFTMKSAYSPAVVANFPGKAQLPCD